MIKTFTNQQGKKFVFVEVPEIAKEHYLSNTLGNSMIVYKAYGGPCVRSIPTNNYQIIGLSKDLTEEQCKQVVGNGIKHWKSGTPIFEDFTYYTKKSMSSNGFLESAIESVKSKIKSLGFKSNNVLVLQCNDN